jgi:hypothetical protein
METLLIRMRALPLVILVALTASGCFWNKKSPTPPPGALAGTSGFSPVPTAAAGGTKPVVTPDTSLTGKVVRVNSAARYVVLNFPIGHLPATEQKMNLYRGGLKVGEVKVTGPQRDDNIVADVIAGAAEEGDEARER